MQYKESNDWVGKSIRGLAESGKFEFVIICWIGGAIRVVDCNYH